MGFWKTFFISSLVSEASNSERDEEIERLKSRIDELEGKKGIRSRPKEQEEEGSIGCLIFTIIIMLLFIKACTGT